ncbi:hypothetical protein L2E82_22783 [Cichorium intybus]|uniref:Uncharacterized protein n=1 Tax=Cichorium intybus TaxID=13427 RepID=A0ACB9DZP4_CICIN|nr:hypothetical protein L2E82_22783 [Cichorium intybus]
MHGGGRRLHNWSKVVFPPVDSSGEGLVFDGFNFHERKRVRRVVADGVLNARAVRRHGGESRKQRHRRRVEWRRRDLESIADKGDQRKVEEFR